MRDLYSILGVSDRANSAEIKAAYRLQAKLSHPDLHLGDEEAARRIQDINYAYRVLSDPEARSAYDFKRMLPRIWARRRRRSAIAATGLAVFMLAMTTLSVTWRKPAESPPRARDEVTLKSSPAPGGVQTVEASAEALAHVSDSARPVQEPPFGGPASGPAGESPEDSRKPRATDIVALPAPPPPSEQPVTPLSPKPMQGLVLQSEVAVAVPPEPRARQLVSVDQKAGPQVVQGDSTGDHSVQRRIQKRPAEGDRPIKSAKTRLRTAQQDSGEAPRLVSSSAAALPWPSADEPFVNMGVRGR